MADIIDKIAAIRAADYGIEVKKSIADGIESINIEVVNTTERQTVLETDMSTAKADAIQATADANTATTNADNATEVANIAITEANTARDNANEKATLADSKATLAQTATDIANTTVENINNNTLIIYKPWVANFAAIATAYPAPVLGWTTQTIDTNTRYRYNGTAWTNIGAFSGDKTGDMSQISETNLVQAVLNDRSQLADMTKDLNDYKHLIVNGDWSIALQTAINESLDNAVIKIPHGVIIKNPVCITNINAIRFIGDRGKEEVNPNITVSGAGTIDLLFTRNCTFENISFLGDRNNRPERIFLLGRTAFGEFPYGHRFINCGFYGHCEKYAVVISGGEVNKFISCDFSMASNKGICCITDNTDNEFSSTFATLTNTIISTTINSFDHCSFSYYGALDSCEALIKFETENCGSTFNDCYFLSNGLVAGKYPDVFKFLLSQSSTGRCVTITNCVHENMNFGGSFLKCVSRNANVYDFVFVMVGNKFKGHSVASGYAFDFQNVTLLNSLMKSNSFMCSGVEVGRLKFGNFISCDIDLPNATDSSSLFGDILMSKIVSRALITSLQIKTPLQIRGSIIKNQWEIYIDPYCNDIFKVGRIEFTKAPDGQTLIKTNSRIINVMPTSALGGVNTNDGDIAISTGVGTVQIKVNGIIKFLQPIVACTTATRPTVSIVGFHVFDTTLNKGIDWNGSVWKDGSGVTV